MNIVKKIRNIYNRLRGVDIIDIDQLQKSGVTIGEGCHIMGGVQFDYGHAQHIFIGNNVTIAPGAYILAHDASTFIHLDNTRIGKVYIKDNVFIGARAIILPNITIGENSIIGVGSIVTKSIPKNVVAVGNPAKVICTLDAFLSRKKEEMKHVPVFSEAYTKRIVPDNQVNKRKELNIEMNEAMKNGVGYIE